MDTKIIVVYMPMVQIVGILPLKKEKPTMVTKLIKTGKSSNTVVINKIFLFNCGSTSTMSIDQT